MQRNATELTFERVVYPQRLVESEGLHSMSWTLTLARSPGETGICAGSPRKEGGPSRKQTWEKAPRKWEMVRPLPHRSRESCWGALVTKRSTQAHVRPRQAWEAGDYFSRLSSAQQSSLKPDWRNVLQQSLPWIFFLEYLPLILSPLFAHLFQGLVNRHPDSPLSTSPSPRLTRISHVYFVFIIFHLLSCVNPTSNPHFYLGLFFMKLLLHMKGFPSLRVYNRTGTSFWILK